MSDVNETFRNVIRAEFGRQVDDGRSRPLPIVLGGMSPFVCHRCGRLFRPSTFHVEPVEGPASRPICRYCAHEDDRLKTWQEFCDAADSIDQLMQRAAGRDQRLLLAELVAKYADHFARWRWPEEETDEEKS